jgi:hypothetical protein
MRNSHLAFIKFASIRNWLRANEVTRQLKESPRIWRHFIRATTPGRPSGKSLRPPRDTLSSPVRKNILVFRRPKSPL